MKRVLGWLRSGSEVVHLATAGSTAAFCGQSLHDAVPADGEHHTCGHCLRSRTYRELAR